MPENEIERRNVELIEFRLVMDEKKKPKIEGHAAVFNKFWDEMLSDMFGFKERVAVGAFASSIRKDDIRALFNHDANLVLGRNKAKTLTLKEDELGLAITIDPPDTSYSHDLQESMRRGDISQMSIGFIVTKDTWEHKKGSPSIRTIEEVTLRDVSPVTFPAYPQTSVAVRDYLNTLKEAEKLDKEVAHKGTLPRLEKLRLLGYKISKKEVKTK